MTKITCSIIRCKHNANCFCTLREVRIVDGPNCYMRCSNYEFDADGENKWDLTGRNPRLSAEKEESHENCNH